MYSVDYVNRVKKETEEKLVNFIEPKIFQGQSFTNFVLRNIEIGYNGSQKQLDLIIKNRYEKDGIMLPLKDILTKYNAMSLNTEFLIITEYFLHLTEKIFNADNSFRTTLRPNIDHLAKVFVRSTEINNEDEIILIDLLTQEFTFIDNVITEDLERIRPIINVLIENNFVFRELDDIGDDLLDVFIDLTNGYMDILPNNIFTRSELLKIMMDLRSLSFMYYQDSLNTKEYKEGDLFIKKRIANNLLSEAIIDNIDFFDELILFINGKMELEDVNFLNQPIFKLFMDKVLSTKLE